MRTAPVRRSVQGIVAIVSFALAGAVDAPIPADAAFLNVVGCDPTSASDELDLQRSLHAANDESSTPGADRIFLAPGCTYTFDAPAVDGFPEALPAITSTITIEGRGSTIRTADPLDPAVTRLFRVEDTGDLTVRRVTLHDARGPVGIGGGAIYNRGTTHIDESTVTANNRGAVLNGWGRLLTVTDSSFVEHDVIAGDAMSSQGRLVLARSRFTDEAGVTVRCRARWLRSAAVVRSASGATRWPAADAGASTQPLSRSMSCDRDAGASPSSS